MNRRKLLLLASLGLTGVLAGADLDCDFGDDDDCLRICDENGCATVCEDDDEDD